MKTADRSATFVKAGCAAALVIAAPFAQALDGITDPANDFLPTFAGDIASSAYLDVISASAFYNPASDTFTLVATMNGAIPTAPVPGFYVWGVNRGAGVASFAANGITGVRFDATVQLRPNGTGSVGATALPAGSVTISGSTITGVVSAALLPGTGFVNKLDYTWNLWPRDGSAGFTAITDFAPDNANFSTTLSATPVPEPQTQALMLAGLGLLGWWGSRRGSAKSGASSRAARLY